jgi:hypothetical protein
MRFNGEWLQCDDGIVRPVVRAEIMAAHSAWRPFDLLVDTGADRTVLSANVLNSLNLVTSQSLDRLGGIGGLVDTVTVTTRIRLTRDDEARAHFAGEFAACTKLEMLDMSVLGRDVLNMFAVIIDRRADLVTMIGGQHRYSLQG